MAAETEILELRVMENKSQDVNNSQYDLINKIWKSDSIEAPWECNHD